MEGEEITLPVMDAEAPTETVGLPLSDTLIDGKEPVPEAVASNDNVGLPYPDIEALRHMESVQPYGKIEE